MSFCAHRYFLHPFSLISSCSRGTNAKLRKADVSYGRDARCISDHAGTNWKLFMLRSKTCRLLHCRGSRCFSLTTNLGSGHSRWSKIKHDKAKVDVCTQAIEIWEEELIDHDY